MSATERAAEVLAQVAFREIAAEKGLTIMPTDFGAEVPPHWRKEAESRAKPYLYALAAAGLLTPDPDPTALQAFYGDD